MTIGASERSVRRWFGALVITVACIYGATELAAFW
jgi:long-subunit acyl-CoA synthetase (AMP-forming)